MLRINDIDISQYGGVMTKGSCKSVIQYPPMKDVEYNDWFEKSGIDPDLSNPRADSREITIDLFFNSASGLNNFVALFGSKRVHKVELVDIKVLLYLRGKKITSIKISSDTYATASVIFIDDQNRAIGKFLPKTTISTPSYGIEINGVDISAFGAIPLKGTRSELSAVGDIKEPLVQEISVLDGVVSSSIDSVNYGLLKANMKLLFKGVDIDELMNNYNAMLYAITRPGGIELKSPYRKNCRCYYDSSKVNSFVFSNKFEIDIDLNIVIYEDIL